MRRSRRRPSADRQRAVVAQQHEVLVADVRHQPLALVVVERDPLVVVIGETAARQSGLVQRQQPSCARHRHAVGVCRCITKWASSRAAWIAEWIVKPAGLMI